MILGWLYERLYHELAWSYDSVSWLVSGGHWQRWQETAIPYLLGTSVLDVGCGTGQLLAGLRHRGISAIGVDLSISMTRLASARTREFGNVVVRGDARALPFSDTSFGSIVLTFPTPIIFNPRLWQELARVLQPGGRVIVVLGARSTAQPWPEQLQKVLARVSGNRRRPGRAELQPPTDTESGINLASTLSQTPFEVQRLREETHFGLVELLLCDLKGTTS